MWKVRSFSALLLALFTASVAAAQGGGRAAGEWRGEISIPGSALRVEVRLAAAESGWTGTIDIPQQGADDLPLTGIRTPGDSAIFTIQNVPGSPTFLGVISTSGDSIIGSFVQGPGSFPFTLVRAGAGANPMEGFDDVARKALADFIVPGVAIGVVKDGKLLYAEGFGLRDVARQLPVTPATLFAIGSSTKAFTTFGLGVMADSGRFDWDVPVREYLPGLRLHDDFAGTRLTARDMVTHRSGLPRHDLAWYSNRNLTPDSMLALIRYFEPNRGLREAWQYNNMMYVLSGYLLGQLTGTSWEDAVRSLILQPLGMQRTNFSVAQSQADPNHALPYREQGDTLVRIPFKDISHVGPAGSINSSIDDMMRWVLVHLEQGRAGDRQVVRASTLREMHTPQMVIPGLPTDEALSPTAYGLGWMTQMYRGHYRVFHGGNIDGFSALVTLFPMDDAGIVVLTNMNGTALPELLTRHAADRVLELEHRDWLGEALRNRTAARQAQATAAERLDEQRVKGTRPSLPLASYAGEYAHPGYGVLQVTVEGDRLQVRYNDLSAPFEHWHYDVFNGLENPRDPVLHNMKLQFRKDVHGRIAEALVAVEPMMPPMVFERRGDAQLRDPAYIARFAGRYAMEAGGAAAITQSGSTLYLEVPGQPPYRLEPDRDNTFRFADIQGFRVRFHLDAAGKVQRMETIQPNGVFVARPVTN